MYLMSINIFESSGNAAIAIKAFLLHSNQLANCIVSQGVRRTMLAGWLANLREFHLSFRVLT